MHKCKHLNTNGNPGFKMVHRDFSFHQSLSNQWIRPKVGHISICFCKTLETPELFEPIQLNAMQVEKNPKQLEP